MRMPFFLFLWAVIALIARFSLSDSFADSFTVQLNLYSGGISFLIFFLLSAFTKFKGLGLGDVILVTVLAFFIGLPWILAIILFSALACIFYILVWKKNRLIAAPLGAFLALNTLFCLFFREVYNFLIAF